MHHLKHIFDVYRGVAVPYIPEQYQTLVVCLCVIRRYMYVDENSPLASTSQQHSLHLKTQLWTTTGCSSRRVSLKILQEPH